MKTVKTMMAAVVLVILVAVVPVARAADTTAAVPAGATVLDQAVLAVGQAGEQARECGDGFTALGTDTPEATCSFGVPRCYSDSSCDSWCFPLWGLCVSGCCACT